MGAAPVTPALVVALLVVSPPDTLPIVPFTGRVVFDGAASAAKWGVPGARIATPAGNVQIWARSAGGSVYLAAMLPDTTVSWRDELVISFDPQGDGGSAPGHGDFQWALRRSLDSSLVESGRNGRWALPGDDPDWRLGGRRTLDQGWEVKSAETGGGWSVEMRFDRAWFEEAGKRLPAIAFRVYNDSPSGSATWPSALDLAQPTMLEMRPGSWAVVGIE